jgi:hypothetical protein
MVLQVSFYSMDKIIDLGFKITRWERTLIIANFPKVLQVLFYFMDKIIHPSYKITGERTLIIFHFPNGSTSIIILDGKDHWSRLQNNKVREHVDHVNFPNGSTRIILLNGQDHWSGHQNNKVREIVDHVNLPKGL